MEMDYFAGILSNEMLELGRKLDWAISRSSIIHELHLMTAAKLRLSTSFK
jgi:hypothetical protein